MFDEQQIAEMRARYAEFRAQIQSVRVSELQVGDILSPTNRTVLGNYSSAYPEMRGKREIILSTEKPGVVRSCTWNAATTVSIKRREK